MHDLDDALARLGLVPVHPCLATIDDAVLARIAVAGTAGGPTIVRSVGVAGLAALGMGMIGSMLPGMPVQAAAPISPLGAPAALAPSTLLGSAE